MRGLDFTAIDFETANASRASACSVGLVRVVDGSVVDTASWLVHPPTEHESFLPRNIKVHGITADHVADAPYWGDVLPEVMAFSGGSTFVAHNASFDRGVFRAVTTASGLAVPDVEFRCSLKLAQSWLELPNHKLPTVAEALGVPLVHHHNACADAEACAHVVLEVAQLQQHDSLAELWPATSRTSTSRATAHVPSRKLSELAQANPDADPTNPLFGHVFVFTGELTSMERDAAMDAVARHGASNGNGVTKKTTILVAATTGTGKERKAHAYIDAGQPIKIITEQEFLAMLDQVQNATALSSATVPTAATTAPEPASHVAVETPVSMPLTPASALTVASSPEPSAPLVTQSAPSTPPAPAREPAAVSPLAKLLDVIKQIVAALTGKKPKSPRPKD